MLRILTRLTALVSLAMCACWTWSGGAYAQPIAGIQATCRTPEVEAKIAVLRAEIAEREPKDEGRGRWSRR